MLVLLVLTLLSQLVSAEPLTDSDQAQIVAKSRFEITHIPGLHGELRSRHYGGYVNVDKPHNRNLYYYFVTSEEQPAKVPLVLWLNGGPGCSSFDGTRLLLACLLAKSCNFMSGTNTALQGSSMSMAPSMLSLRRAVSTVRKEEWFCMATHTHGAKQPTSSILTLQQVLHLPKLYLCALSAESNLASVIQPQHMHAHCEAAHTH